MLKDYFSLAFGNLKHRGLRSWLTILGIFIGIAAVVALISLGAGLREAITGQFGALSVDKLTIQNKGSGFGAPGSTVVEKLNEHDIEIIKSVSGVDLVVPRLIRVVKGEYNKESDFFYVGDLPREQEEIDLVYESLNLDAESGKLLQKGDRGKIVLGNNFKNRDFDGKKIEVGKVILIDEKPFEVAGILKKSSSVQFNMIMIMPNEDLEEILNIKDEYDIIVAQVHDKDKIEQVAKSIEDKLRKDRNEDLGEESFAVETPIQALSAVNTILNIINAIVIGIATISLIVGAVGLANTMYTSVVERTREIGIMKAIGAKNKDILWIFLIESGLLGLVGGIVGALIGLGAAIAVSSIASNALGVDLFKVTINYYLLIGSVVFAFVIGIISGVLPAYQASKLNVVEAIRR